MTTQKALNIGKAGFHVLVMLLAFIPMTLFIIITGFFKVWAVLDDGKEEANDSPWPTSEWDWDAEHPNACPMEKSAARDNGHFY